jgi:hypothetical protein
MSAPSRSAVQAADKTATLSVAKVAPSGIKDPPTTKDSARSSSKGEPSEAKPLGTRGAAKAEPPAPSYFRVARPPPPGASWAPYYHAPWKRGFVTLFGHGKKWSGYLIGSKGEVPAASRASLSDLLASWRTGKEALIDERLIALVAVTSDEFGGRPIRIVSGYREYSYAPDSKHKIGQALDFSIPGVPNEALRDYLRTLTDVGIGYYPNSTHVHLDVRDKSTYWVDYSFPGERPHYAYEPSTRGWGPRERAIADALDRLPSSLGREEAPVPLTVGKPPPPFVARPAPNRAVFAPSAMDDPNAAHGVVRGDVSSPLPSGVSSSGDGGVSTPRTGIDSGSSFWARAASAGPDGGAAALDNGSRNLMR